MAVICEVHKSLKDTNSCKMEAQHYSLSVIGAFTIQNMTVE